MPVNQDHKNWYALYTHSRCEFKVEEALKTEGVTVYLPITKTFKKWSDRKKEITLPMFAGYVFINATEKERLISLQLKQVVRCLTDAGKPAIVPDWQIESLKKMISANQDFNVVEGLIKGDEVEIKSGLFAGVRGVVFEIENQNYLAISIELLKRSVIIHLKENFVTRNHKNQNVF
jgi:transcription antitermination factor NusG